jgi:hypothetical protein
VGKSRRVGGILDEVVEVMQSIKVEQEKNNLNTMPIKYTLTGCFFLLITPAFAESRLDSLLEQDR